MKRYRILLAGRKGLDADGERFVPEHRVSDTALEHIHRYVMAAELAAGRRVLDVACGEGYGSFILSQAGATVMGLDRDIQSIAHAQRLYGASVCFSIGTAEKLPIASGSFDMVVSFETLEHLNDPVIFLDEVQRILRPGGLVICSTPNRDVYARARNGTANPHHQHEMSLVEFAAALKARFPSVLLYGQEIVYGSQIWPLAADLSSRPAETIFVDATTTDIQAGHLREATYLLALASNGSPEALPFSTLSLDKFYNPISALLGGIFERDQEILRLKKILLNINES